MIASAGSSIKLFAWRVTPNLAVPHPAQTGDTGVTLKGLIKTQNLMLLDSSGPLLRFSSCNLQLGCDFRADLQLNKGTNKRVQEASPLPILTKMMSMC